MFTNPEDFEGKDFEGKDFEGKDCLTNRGHPFKDEMFIHFLNDFLLTTSL